MSPEDLLELLRTLVACLEECLHQSTNPLSINQVVLRYYRGWLAVFFRQCLLARGITLPDIPQLRQGGPTALSADLLGDLLVSYQTAWLAANHFRPQLSPPTQTNVQAVLQAVGEVIDGVAEDTQGLEDEANTYHHGLARVFQWGNQRALTAFYFANTGRVIGVGAAGGYMTGFRNDYLDPCLDHHLPEHAPAGQPGAYGLDAEQIRRLRAFLRMGQIAT